MAYPRELLNENEELHLDLRPHWWYFAKHFMMGFFLLAFAVIILFIPSGDDDTATVGGLLSSIKPLLGIILVGLIFVWIFVLVSTYLQWMFTLFVVTSDRVIFRTGIIAKKGTEIPLERVNNINFEQSVFERIIGAGTLDIESAGEDGQSTFRDVRHPDAVQQEIYRCMEKNVRKTSKYATEGLENIAMGMGQANGGGGGGPMSIPEQIEKLAQLRDQNIISEAEFMDKRQKLLDQM